MAGDTITVGGSYGTLINEGTLQAVGGTLVWSGSVAINGTNRLDSSITGTIKIAGNLLGGVQNPVLYTPKGTLVLNGSGTSDDPQLLEVMGRDLGLDLDGFSDNFDYGTLAIKSGNYVRLVDQSPNTATGADEAVYVNSLIVSTDATLDLSGLNVYTRLLQVNGTVSGGAVTQIPDRRIIAQKTPTVGTISAAGELDEWTFVGHGGRSVSIVLNPGSSSPPAAAPPYLYYADVRLLDPTGAVLATAQNTTSGGVVTLADVPLTTDGTYRVQIHAPAPHASNTGNYMLTVSEVLFPRIMASTPFGPTRPPVDAINFAFNHTMDETSFSLTDDVIDFTGPDGDIIPTGFSWTDARHLQVQFASQLSLGEYQIVLGPDILDRYGNPLDQDQDSMGGDPVHDRYVTTFAIEAPRIVNCTPVNPIAGYFRAITFDFNEPVDQTTFSPAEDIVSFTGPAGPIEISSYEWVDADSLTIHFTTQTDTGQYSIVIGPNILDMSGHAMDQNQDLVAGDLVNDAYTGVVLVTASGTIGTDTIFGPEGGPILVRGNLAVTNGTTLTILPGTILKFDAGAGLQVYGRLVTLGTASNPVIFTSLKDDTAGGDTNGDGTASSPAVADWDGLGFYNSSLTSSLHGVDVRYARTAILNIGDVHMRQAVLRNNAIVLYTWWDYTSLTIEETIISNNSHVLEVGGTAGVTIRNCTIAGNQSLGRIGHPVLTVENTIFVFKETPDVWSYPSDLDFHNSVFADADSAQFVISRVGPLAFRENGNIIADPLFVDQATGNYELGPGSPAIDAGRGTLASTTDFWGRPRFDDTGMPNIGTGFPSYVDIGAFERQQATAAGDLAVTFVSRPTPEFVHAGDSFSVQWTVTNVGEQNAAGPWQDVVYFSSDPAISPDDVIVAQETHYGTLTPGTSYSRSISATAPNTVGVRYVLVKTNADRSFLEPVTTNNMLVSPGVLAVDLPVLSLTSPVNGTEANGQWTYARFDATAGKSDVLTLNATATSGSSSLYVRYGAPPTLDHYDAIAAVPNSPDQEVRILAPHEGTYYVGIYGSNLPGGSSPFTLSAALPNLDIRAVSPHTIGNSGRTTIEIQGDNFSQDTEASLVGPGGSSVPGDVWFQDASTIFVTFDLGAASATPGAYDLVVTELGVASVTETYAVDVQAAGAANFKANLVVPGTARPSRTITVVVEYRNAGNVDMLSPLLNLESIEGTAWLLPGADPEDGWVNSTSVSFLGLSSDGPASILRPGEGNSVTLRVRTPFQPGQMPFTLGMLDAGNTATVDWAWLNDSLRPTYVNVTAWDAIYPNLTAQLGSTWGEYVQKLDADAQYLAELGTSVIHVDQLFGFEIQQANGISPLTSLVSANDVQVAAPGLPLSFERAFLPGVIERNQFGRFGRGWTDSWDAHLTLDSDESVNVYQPGGSIRRFPLLSGGGYSSQPGDYGTLATRSGGGYTLTEVAGQVTAFFADGRLDFVQDTNGNHITAGYTGGLLTSLTHSSGQSLTLAYNAAGLVSTITNSVGHSTAYGYDSTNTYLTSVTTDDGKVTSYTYKTAGSVSQQHALTSVMQAGVTRYFSYDARGRLDMAYVASGEQLVDFGYDSAGGVTVSDALGTTSFYFDFRGLLAKVTDPLGNVTTTEYGDDLRPRRIVAPTGESQSFTWSCCGDPTSVTDELGNTVSFRHNNPFKRLTSFTDARGNTTSYAYDANGNLLATTYPDNSIERLGNYTPAGLPQAFTNRRSQAISYTYTASGQVDRQTFADGSYADFDYDARENLTIVTEHPVSGTDEVTAYTYAYATDGDRLRKVTYPDARWVEYFYDALGRRERMTDSAGGDRRYEYDATGRLWKLRDGSDNVLVEYLYDPAGRVQRVNKGNVTYTTYDYDAAGQLLHLVNYAPDNSVNSRFDYTYDSRGRRTAMATLDGNWTYAYDGTSQLTHAVFVSTNPAIAHQDLQYNYDAAGNRTSTVINGVTTDYVANNLNEYTSVGGTTYQYDADGNLTFDGARSYVYDAQNRLVRVTGPEGVTEYEYDAFGNRVATVLNGERTEYLLDPTGLVNVAAEYDGIGNLVARYTQGLGLISQIDALGSAFYYDFDALGSTAGLTNSAGGYANSYSYMPFGGGLTSSETVANPFQFVGASGVMKEDNGLDFMRARYFDSSIGRFVTRDPIAGINLYTYSLNDPVNLLDPTGLLCWSKEKNDALWKEVDSVKAEIDTIKHLLEQGITDPFSDPLSDSQRHYLERSLDQAYRNYNNLMQQLADLGSADRCPPHPPPPPGGLPGGGGNTGGPGPDEVTPPIPQTTPIASGNLPLLTSASPEDKQGPAGYDAPGTPAVDQKHFVLPDQTFNYRIDMWNKPDAPAPTQDATIYDYLDPDLFDLSTFEFTRVGFLKWDQPLPGGQVISTRIDTRPDMNIAVDIMGMIDQETGRIDWWFHTVDPLTGDYPDDPNAGFLPPVNPATFYEIAWMEFTVKLKPGLPTGTVIANQAFVQFDFLGPWGPAPKEAPWVNTIDAGRKGDRGVSSERRVSFPQITAAHLFIEPCLYFITNERLMILRAKYAMHRQTDKRDCGMECVSC
ncbi:MAG: RHS repeat-associated core domain-containing protein [Pirellulaceae bacterium]